MGLGCTGRFRVVSVSTNGIKKPEEIVDDAPEDMKEDSKRFRKVAVLSSKATSGFRCMDDFTEAELRDIETAVREGRSKLIEAQHTRCANISVVRFESATNTDLLVSSFNINTNKWMLE